MKNRNKKVDYFTEMFDAECEYRAATSGNNSNRPFDNTQMMFSVVSDRRNVLQDSQGRHRSSRQEQLVYLRVDR